MTKSILWCATIGAFVTSTAAIAADPATSIQDALKQFPNVKVISSPAPATQAAPAQAGMKAYIDENGKLRGPTMEEMQSESAASAPVVQRRLAASSRMTTMANGTQAIPVDESLLMYSVVVRQADGSLKEVCVPGEQAQAIISGKLDVSAVTTKEESNDR